MLTQTQTNFITEIATAVNKYKSLYSICVASPIIAQAILESNWGKSQLAYKYHNYFGLKCGSYWTGKSVNMTTKEEYTKGTLTTIKDNFRVYDSLEDGVLGYFVFTNTKRYSNLKGVTDYKTYIKNIKADGYATSSTYIDSLIKLVQNYSLTQYDDLSTKIVIATTDDIETLARDVIKGKYGNGNERKLKLGSLYERVQKRVNEILKTK
jgi:flagellum-specific peptidoglycan hydrolase FlgJ